MIVPQPHRRSVGRGGFTLVEMLVVLGALVVALLLGTVVLVGSARVEQAAAESFQRLAAQAALADQFRQDVSRADAAPQQFGKLRSGRDCLLLANPDNSYVVYTFSEGRLRRAVRNAAGEGGEPQPLGPECQAEFSQGQGGGRLVVLRLRQPRGPGVPDREVLISAALGGDLR